LNLVGKRVRKGRPRYTHYWENRQL
jgi:hypothetical protein